MKFDEAKAKYGYKIFTSDDDYFNDIDGIKQVACNDGKFRWIAFELKHKNEDMSKIDNQVKALLEILPKDVPLVVCELNVDTVKVIDGLITKDGTKVADTKTAWFNINDCTIKKVFNIEELNLFCGVDVGTFLSAVKNGFPSTEKIHSVNIEQWYGGLNG